MLILLRRPGETVCIGDEIELTVHARHGRQVKIGIEAPESVPIRRAELGSWSEEGAKEPVPEER